jgi:hypothetical protein
MASTGAVMTKEAPIPPTADAIIEAGARSGVLVHGAWADGSSWAKVITLLQSAGLRPKAASNPLTSSADDVAAARRTAVTTQAAAA